MLSIISSINHQSISHSIDQSINQSINQSVTFDFKLEVAGPFGVDETCAIYPFTGCCVDNA
jgi:hypothetical protein